MIPENTNFILSGYHPIALLYKGNKTLVYRAVPQDHSLAKIHPTVVVKLLASDRPNVQELLQFRHQFTIAKNLDSLGIVRLLSLEEFEQGYILVMEDYGGISLVDYSQSYFVSLADFLAIAIQLADILNTLGQQRIIHKDIKPANILINPTTKQVKLIDFSIASLLPRENQEFQSPQHLEGTLPYLSPEQTGRMNRGIDYRTDYYALGVTLYELLTGQLPFMAEDAIDFIHCHLAQQPVPAHEVKPAIPLVISQIIAKLMAKNVEDRYQSALGLKYDLEQCLIKSQANGVIAEFKLGQRDVNDRFLIPEKIYGRAADVQTLLAAFERVSRGWTEFILVAGFSGIGKTALINEVHKPITRQHGYFIKGKCDQFNRNIPLAVFVQAFRDLINQLLSESSTQLAHWQNQILAAVGDNGQVLIEAIPELEEIIGKQPPATILTGKAAQYRFNLLFQKFVEVFTTAEHPLVMFLDDLQWADTASCQLIKLLMGGQGYFLLLGAYRDNEISPIHPFMLMLEELRQAEVKIQSIILAPLSFLDTSQLVADTLHCSTERSQPLATLIDRKTKGNPFFITQFLRALEADGELRFNRDGYWECDIVRIQALSLTDDVVELMATQLQRLPIATQSVLKLAACIGNQFDIETLAIISEQSQVMTATALWKGLQAGLVLPTSRVYKFFSSDFKHQLESSPTVNSTYRFLHDRVQQAAYSLIPADQKQHTHLQAGRLLLNHSPDPQNPVQLFAIVNHFNAAQALLLLPDEQKMLAQLNLQAALRAKAATAYTTAIGYAQIGIELLGKAAWHQNYHLVLALYETLAEVTFLQGDCKRFPVLVQVVLDNAVTPIDRVKTYEIIILFHTIQKQYQVAIKYGLEILQQLGLKLSPQPQKLILLKELAHTKIAIGSKSNDKLLGLPAISNPVKIATLRILDLLLTPAFFCSQELMVVLVNRGIRLTLRYGNNVWAASLYASYCILLSRLGYLQESCRIGQLAIDLADRFGNAAITTKVKVLIPWFSQPLRQELRASITVLDESIRAAMDSGNLTFLGISAGMSMLARLCAGISLDDLAEKMPDTEKLIVQSRDKSSQEFFALLQQTIMNLRQFTHSPYHIVGSERDEAMLVSQWQSSNEVLLLSTLYGFKTYLAYYFADIPKALEYADAQLCFESAESGMTKIQVWLFDALTRLAAYPLSDKATQQKLLKQVNINQSLLWKYAQLMPTNFLHKYELVAAEKCRILADFPGAMKLYDQAIAGSRANNFLPEEALGNELAAKFYLAWGKEKIAATYMHEAYFCYSRWGAKVKADSLESKYPQLLNFALASTSAPEFDPLSTLSSIANSTNNSYQNNPDNTFDLAAVIQSAQAISSNLDLAELVQQLIHIILKNSGAETCILALPDGQNTWQIKSVSIYNSVENSQHCPQAHDYPLSLINWVKNTQKSTILNARQSLDIVDQYLLEHQPPSVFTLPILKQAKVLGVIYLEHRGTPDIFTESKKTVISFLCSQAAIALENAHLYQKSRQVEEALRASEHRYSNLVSNVPAALYQFERNADGIFKLNYVSARFSELFEVSAAAVLADVSVLLNLIIPEDRLSFYQAIEESTVSGKPWAWEGRWLMSTRKIKWIRGESIPTYFSDQSIVWDGVLIDITDRKEAEIALRSSENRYQKLSDNIPGVIYQFKLTPDGQLHFPYISSGCLEIFKLTPTEIIANPNLLLQIIHPDDIVEFQKTVAESAQNMTHKSWEGRAVLGSGEIIWIKSASRPELQGDGSIVWDGVLLDITERKQAQFDLQITNEQLQLMNTELQRATRLKDEFLATMSHELRTPLNAILGMSEVLQEEVFGSLNTRQLKSVNTIERSGEHLLSLINDILDFSKISAGKLELNLTQVSLADLCTSSLMFIKQAAFDKQIKLYTHLPTTIDKIFVDELRIRQVLINLLNNAVKFTADGGEVTLSVQVGSPEIFTPETGYCLCISVSDTGIGIAQDDQQKLFQPFIQVDSNLNRKYEGTGLGLVLVKQIIDLHGGIVTLDSEVDKGSCFTIMLPQTSSPSALRFGDAGGGIDEVISATALPPLILLAEDNEVNINTFSSYLLAKGYRVICAHNGREAITLTQLHHPQLILMDIQMPDLDGLAAIECIRQQSTFSSIPIIALTALTMPGDREKCLAAGADQYLAKPIKMRELHNSIQSLIDMN